ncbi:MAG: hypothetical protein AB7I19_18195 [Planctomycetota bacterium]
MACVLATELDPREASVRRGDGPTRRAGRRARGSDRRRPARREPFHVHFHTLWPDGVFTRSYTTEDRVTFHPAPELTYDDIDKLARAIRQRVLRYLRKHDRLPDDGVLADDPTALERSVLHVLGAAAVQGRIALGPNAGTYAPRLGRG